MSTHTYKHNTHLLIFSKYVYTYIHVPIYILKNGRINQKRIEIIIFMGRKEGKEAKGRNEDGI